MRLRRFLDGLAGALSARITESSLTIIPFRLLNAMTAALEVRDFLNRQD